MLWERGLEAMKTWVPALALPSRCCDPEADLPVPPPFRAGVKAPVMSKFHGDNR